MKRHINSSNVITNKITINSITIDFIIAVWPDENRFGFQRTVGNCSINIDSKITLSIFNGISSNLGHVQFDNLAYKFPPL